MGKLLGRIFKDDFKSIILWLLLPLVFALVFTQLLNAFGENPLVMVGLSLTLTLLIIGPFVALISVAINDYERFYGKYAAFFSSLPYKTSTITGARFLNYVLMALVAGICAFVNYFIMIMSLSTTEASLSELFELFGRALEVIGGKNLIAIIIYILILAIVSIFQVMFAISAGSSRVFGKPSKAKVILIFIITSLILGLIFGRIQIASVMEYENLEYINQIGTNIELVTDNDLTYKAMLAPIGFNILVSAILAWLTHYLHGKKLSVA